MTTKAEPWPAIRRVARAWPDRPALVTDGEMLDYRALAGRVEAAMRGLLRRGVDPERASGGVALPAEPSVDTLVAVAALVELGVPVVPIHPKLAAEERASVLSSLRPAVVLGPGEVGALVESRGDDVPLQGAPVPPDRPLAVVATSGTTGTPKGVVLSRRAFEAAAAASEANLGFRDGDRWLLCMPIAHVGGLSVPLRTLAAGRTTVCAPPGGFDPEVIAAAIERHRVTLVSLVPTMLSRLLDRSPAWEPPSHLRAVLLGGAAPSSALLDRARDRRVPVLTTYGLTETCGQVTTARPGTPPSAEVGAGGPLPGMGVRIVDGEIRVRGPSLLRGYREGSTERGPALDPDGFLRTGDAGWLDTEGRLHVSGRLDDRIVTGGENVDPLEVERVLEGIDGVAAACVFGLPDPTWGQVVAAALVADGPPPSLEDLLAVTRERLAPHRRPRRVAFVSDLPTTRSGKVDRRAVASRVGSCVRPL